MTSCTVLLLWDATRAALEMTLWPEYFTQGPQQESEKHVLEEELSHIVNLT